MRKLLRKHPYFFLTAIFVGVVLRLLFVIKFPDISDDSLVYGEIAKNWLQHGIYGLTGNGGIYSTYIRLPGYPAFLAIIFGIFGIDHYRAVLVTQMLLDIGTCFFTADLARRIHSNLAARVAFALTAVCPFLANYAAAALSETLEIFFTVLALDLAIAGAQNRNLKSILFCGLSIGGTILIRPDGGILLISTAACFAIWAMRGIMAKFRERPPADLYAGFSLRAAVLVTAISLVVLIPWTVRNWVTMHRFQPLAPRYANEDDEFVSLGFNRWVKTWMAEYVSVEEIYWNVPGGKIDATLLPSRAFDSLAQKERTFNLFRTYNSTLDIGPKLDRQFTDLAAERIHAHPLRYYMVLPLARIADMWLRPRTEIMPADPRWWEFNDEWKGSALAIG
ncbi:MAG TPA: glycosyltransferase family 39 protein, partial [Candidatus Kapabacteria bacterium]|nr:glycosyltransferase family 39 protein [Candidatus Kapabacteria bacterium]